jgi:hypothetical protein
MKTIFEIVSSLRYELQSFKYESEHSTNSTTLTPSKNVTLYFYIGSNMVEQTNPFFYVS